MTRSIRFPSTLPPSSSSANDKRFISLMSQNKTAHSIVRKNLSSNKSISSSIDKDETKNLIPSEHVYPSFLPTEEISSSAANTNSNHEQPIAKQQLSSHSSSSSLSSLLKRQSKPPPVVFLNKSIDIELNDVSFGFDLDSITLSKASDDDNNNINNNDQSPLTTIELNIDTTEPSTSPSARTMQSNNLSTDSAEMFPQRSNRSPQFYSGSDIRPYQQRNFPSHPMSQLSPYIDPFLLFQYNQQRLANYPQHMTYMSSPRPHYMPSQSQYVFLPTIYTTTKTNDTDSIDQTSSDQNQESLFVHTTQTGQLYFQPSTIKKSSTDDEQQPNSIPTIYATPNIYPSHCIYLSAAHHLIPSHTAYFQPIPSSSFFIGCKSEENDLDIIDDYITSTDLYHEKRRQSSSDIMSNALQLVYSQQRRNAQTDRFNLDDLTAYLALKWTDTVDHYEQGIDQKIIMHTYTFFLYLKSRFTKKHIRRLYCIVRPL